MSNDLIWYKILSDTNEGRWGQVFLTAFPQTFLSSGCPIQAPQTWQGDAILPADGKDTMTQDFVVFFLRWLAQRSSLRNNHLAVRIKDHLAVDALKLVSRWWPQHFPEMVRAHSPARWCRQATGRLPEIWGRTFLSHRRECGKGAEIKMCLRPLTRRHVAVLRRVCWRWKPLLFALTPSLRLPPPYPWTQP